MRFWKDGWLNTGDMARMDEDGFILSGGPEKGRYHLRRRDIYPVQIEDFLRACNKIKDVAVIGLPDDRPWGDYPRPLLK
jgi:acyl-CoA synthetase (AMP-forming)/AMP-acid ligase II